MSDSTYDIHQIRQAIDAGNAQWIRAYKHADAQLLAAVFTEDGQLLRWDGTVTRGRSAIYERMNAAMQRLGPAEVSITTLKVWPIDDLAYEHGAYIYQFRDENQQAVTSSGKFVVIWKRQSDGSYRIALDMGLPDEP